LLPPLLDTMTGETVKRGKGNMYEMFSPFRKSDGKTSPVHQVLVEYGVPQYFPPKKIDGVELSAKQYNRWIELATEDGRLADMVVSFAQSPDIVRLAGRDLGEAQTLISKVISDAYSTGKERLIMEDPDLEEKIKEIKEMQKDYGKYRR